MTLNDIKGFVLSLGTIGYIGIANDIASLVLAVVTIRHMWILGNKNRKEKNESNIRNNK